MIAPARRAALTAMVNIGCIEYFLRESRRFCTRDDIKELLKWYFNPDYSLGREMMVRQVARHFYRLREVHRLDYGRRAIEENGRKLTASNRSGQNSRLMNDLG